MIEQFKTREEWLELRKTGIGGSDISAIMKIVDDEEQKQSGKWKSPLDVYMSKVEGVEVETNIAMRMGSYLEPFVLSEWVKDSGAIIVDKCPDWILRDKDHPFLVGSFDALVELDGKLYLAEIKTKSTWSWKSMNQRAPASEQWQIMHYLRLLKKEPGYEHIAGGLHICMTLDDRRIYQEEVAFDQECADQIVKEAGIFWETHIIAKNPPAPIKVEDLAYIEPIPQAGKVATDEDLELVTCINSLKEEISALEAPAKALKANRKEVTDALKISMLDNENLYDSDGTLLATFKQGKRSRTLLMK